MACLLEETVRPYPTLRAVKMYIGKSPVCRAAVLGVKEVKLEIRPKDAIVGGTGAAGPAAQRRICNTNRRSTHFLLRKKVGIGIYYLYIYINWDILWISFNLSIKYIILVDILDSKNWT